MIADEVYGNTLRILAGSGRSGTTWLLDVLCQANQLHPVFEPLHPNGWSKALPFSRRYASAQQPLKGLDQFWQAISRGKYPSTWIDYRVRPDRLVPRLQSVSSWSEFKRYSGHWLAYKRHRSLYVRGRHQNSLIKAIRANLLLPQLTISEQVHWALVIRHPATVVESQLRLRGDWNARDIASLYANDRNLAQRLGCEWGDWVNRMKSDAELFTLIWCVENLLPLEDIDKAEQNVVFYENLSANEEPDWNKLLMCLRLEHKPAKDDLVKPSQQSSEEMGQVKDERVNKKQDSSPLERLTTKDKDQIQRVLDLFGVGFYHTDSLRPQADKLLVSKAWRSI